MVTSKAIDGISRASMAIAAVSTIVEWYDFTLYLYLATVLSRVFFGGAQGSLVITLAGFAARLSAAAAGRDCLRPDRRHAAAGAA